MHLFPEEIVYDRHGHLAFWPTLFRYWLRFAPFWIGAAFGAAVTFITTR